MLSFLFKIIFLSFFPFSISYSYSLVLEHKILSSFMSFSVVNVHVCLLVLSVKKSEKKKQTITLCNNGLCL